MYLNYWQLASKPFEPCSTKDTFFPCESHEAALLKLRPVPQFTREINAQPHASAGLSPGAAALQQSANGDQPEDATGNGFYLQAPLPPLVSDRLQFSGEAIAVEANAARSGFGAVAAPTISNGVRQNDSCGNQFSEDTLAVEEDFALASLRPLGQVRESFILAVNSDGLWIIDQHVAHERVLFERILRERSEAAIEGQRLLMPLIVELTPGQQAVFAEISEELKRNGFEVELFGTRTVAVKTSPAGVQAAEVEAMLIELLDQFQQEEQQLNLEKVRARIAASIA